MRMTAIAALACGLVAGCGQAEHRQAAETPAPAPAPEASAPGQGGFAGGGFAEQTLDQMLQRTLARFDRADADHDGKLTQAERDQQREQARARREAAGEGSPDGGPGGGDRSGFRGGGGFARADADGDGVVTRAEVETQTRDRFERLDADGDGTVTRDELVAGFGGRGGGDAG
jgi:hypothetical protein